MKCSICKGEVKPSNGYRRVVGWERLRRPSSDTKAFHAPERSDTELACRECVEKLKRGISPAQEALI
jgi:hypothetical protein